MTATAARPATADPFTLHWAGQHVITTDLWFPDRQGPVGLERGDIASQVRAADPVRYVVWVPAPGRNRGGELAPRKALHVGLRTRRTRLLGGLHDCQGCPP